MSQGHLFNPNDRGFARRDHPETSHEAAEKIAEPAGTLRARVLSFIEYWGGATDEEIQLGLKMNPSTERPRRVELVERGLVEDSGETRPTRSGRKATVWRSTRR